MIIIIIVIANYTTITTDFIVVHIKTNGTGTDTYSLPRHRAVVWCHQIARNCLYATLSSWIECLLQGIDCLIIVGVFVAIIIIIVFPLYIKKRNKLIN